MTKSKLYTFWRIIGLGPFNLTDDNTIEISYGGAFYSTVLSLGYGVCYFRVMINRSSYHQPNDTLMSIIADLAAKTCEFFMIVTTWLCFGYRQELLATKQASFRKIVETCRVLRLPEVCFMSIASFDILTVCTNCAWMTLFVTSNILIWALGDLRTTVRIPFNFGRLVYANFIILFIFVMTVIRDKFQSLNAKIKDGPRARDDPTGIENRRHENLVAADCVDPATFTSPLINYVQVHAELVNLTTFVITFCSTPLYLTMMIHLCELASTVYDICINWKDQKVWPPQDHGYFIILFIWLAIHLVGLVAMVAICDSTTNEANEIARNFHKFLLVYPSEIPADLAEIVSLRLLRRPLEISIFGAFRMNYNVVYKIGSIITTYITIMMQLDDQRTLTNRKSQEH